MRSMIYSFSMNLNLLTFARGLKTLHTCWEDYRERLPELILILDASLIHIDSQFPRKYELHVFVGLAFCPHSVSEKWGWAGSLLLSAEAQLIPAKKSDAVTFNIKKSV